MCIRDNSGIWRAVKEREGADEGPYVDGSGAEHEMLVQGSTGFIISGASEAEVNGVYKVHEVYEHDGGCFSMYQHLVSLKENCGKQRFKHAERDIFIWWSGNWHISTVDCEDACEAAGGDAACMKYYWACEHLPTPGHYPCGVKYPCESADSHWRAPLARPAVAPMHCHQNRDQILSLPRVFTNL